MNLQRRLRLTLILHAKKEGWKLYRINEWNYVFKRITKRNGEETFNLYWNSKNFKFSVSTAMNHPKRGKNQLYRKYLDVDDVKNLLSNPRYHSQVGYRKKVK